jgi:hypothetical protein
LRSPAVSHARPASREDLKRIAGFVSIPDSLHALLTKANGLLAYGGYFRVLGIGGASSVDLVSWNDPGTWKFAWPEHVNDYFCFAETGFGDQYAFRYDELSRSRQPVHFLESLTLQPEQCADDFDAFLRDELLRNATQPYDEMIVSARRSLGDLSVDEHVIYSPSPLITGSETVENLMKLPAVASMIINGDLASQLRNGPAVGQIQRVDVVFDDKGRGRIKVLWADTPAT